MRLPNPSRCFSCRIKCFWFQVKESTELLYEDAIGKANHRRWPFEMPGRQAGSDIIVIMVVLFQGKGGELAVLC